MISIEEFNKLKERKRKRVDLVESSQIVLKYLKNHRFGFTALELGRKVAFKDYPRIRYSIYNILRRLNGDGLISHKGNYYAYRGKNGK